MQKLWFVIDGTIFLLFCSLLERTLLSGYQLWVEHVPPDDLDSDRHSCSLVQDTVIETIPRVSPQNSQYIVRYFFMFYTDLVVQDDTAFRLRSTDSSLSSLPIYTCMYRAWVSYCFIHHHFKMVLFLQLVSLPGDSMSNMLNISVKCKQSSFEIDVE